MDEVSIAVINTKLDGISAQMTSFTQGQANHDGRLQALELAVGVIQNKIGNLETATSKTKGSWQSTASTVASVVAVLIVIGGLIYLGPSVGR